MPHDSTGHPLKIGDVVRWHGHLYTIAGFRPEVGRGGSYGIDFTEALPFGALMPDEVSVDLVPDGVATPAETKEGVTGGEWEMEVLSHGGTEITSRFSDGSRALLAVIFSPIAFGVDQPGGRRCTRVGSAEANARLMVAAPALLKACRALLRLEEGTSALDEAQTIALADAAIALAGNPS